MAITLSVKQAPETLPPARLYLDDLEHVIQIFRETPNAHGTEPESVTFQLGSTSCNEFGDLRKLGKKPSALSMTVEHSNGFAGRLEITPQGARWWAVGQTTDEAWATYRKLEALFQSRRPRMLPSTAEALTIQAISIAGVILYFTVSSFRPFANPLAKIPEALKIPAIIITGLAAFPLALAVSRRLVPQQTLTLRYSWEEAELREGRRFAVSVATISATLGLIAGLVLDALVRKLLHW
jgi:hypothetical protein